MTTVTDATDAPVRKTITVKVSVERAFDVFTEGFDTWWPRSHNIGQSPMEKAVIETLRWRALLSAFESTARNATGVG